jgi:hypothetical protein
LKSFLSKHAVRLIGLLGAVLPVLAARWPDVPWEALVGVVAGLLGLGEVAQRKADARTATAWALAEAGQLALAEIEKLQEKPVEPTAAEVPAPAVQPSGV